MKTEESETRPYCEPSCPTTLSRHELIRIANWQTVLSRDEMKRMVEDGSRGAHESLLRSYQILDKVKRLLKSGTPTDVVLELITLMESDDCQPYAWHEQQYKKQSESQ